MSLDQLTPIILPFLILLILALAAPIVREAYRMLRSVRVRLRSRAAQAALDALTAIAGTAVAAAAAEVRDLKDPTKPGTWTTAVAHRILERVIEEVRRLGGDFIAQLRSLGVVSPDAVYDLLERIVEAQVERLRRLEPPAPPALSSADLEEPRPTLEPSPLRGSTIPISVAPPAERGFARPAVLALILFLALMPLFVGCETVREGVMRIAPGVPSRTDCEAGTQRCSADQVPEVCSGSGRWWPALSRRADGSQRVCTGGCALTDAGVAVCVSVIPENPFTDAAVAAEGGAR